MIALLVRYWSILCHLFTRGSLINYVSDNMLAFGLTDYVARLVARCTVLIVLGYKGFCSGIALGVCSLSLYEVPPSLVACISVPA